MAYLDRHRTTAVATILAVTILSGCAVTKVDATNRGNLAKDVMQRDMNAHHLVLELHQYASKENTAGGYSAGGGGCGCN